jgi:FkbM family methyltransferase
LNILVHTSFIGTTGYANHARSFFTSLNKHHNVKVRNLTIGNSWKGYSLTPHDGELYLTEEMKDMLFLQSLYNSEGVLYDEPIYSYESTFRPDVHIVLVEMNNHYFYNDYDGYKIAYNVWESTRYPDDFFNRLFYFDEVWVPTEWQYESLVEQGYPSEKIRVVPEGVDVNTFKPIDEIPEKEKFRFLLFGRWDYRKSTTEIIRTFGETFMGNDDVELICSVENPYAYDGFKTTQERIEHYGFNYPNVKFIDFVSREDYVKYLQEGDVFLSCARSEGWNLPLCIPKGKLIYVNQGFKTIENVEIDDVVITHTGNFNKVTNKFKREYNGDLVSIKLYNDYETISVTPEHPIFVIKRNEFITKKGRFQNINDIEPKWIEAKNIEIGDLVIRTTIKQKYFENIFIDLLDFDEKLVFDEDYVWYKNGYNSKGEQKKYNRYVNLWNLSFLFGWYISEGTFDNNKLIFTLNAENEKNIAEEILKQIKLLFNADGTISIKNKTLRVSVSSKILSKLFKKYCQKLAYNKIIPDEFLFGPSQHLKILLENMVLGDGHITKNGYRYTTTSEILSRQLVFTNQRLDIKTSSQISKRKRLDKRKCYVLTWSINNENGRHSNKSWWVNNGLAILVKDVVKTPYNGYVYNIEVENDNSYLMSNATLHNCEAIACGTPSIYSEWGGQLQFAKGHGIPVKISHLRQANIADRDMPGEYCEPDFSDLSEKLLDAYNNFTFHKFKAKARAKFIHEKFNWESIGEYASYLLNKSMNPFVFVTCGNLNYMSVIEKLVQSLLEFSKQKIMVYGINCDIPFDYPNVIKRRLDPTPHSLHDKWYWKQHACIDSLNSEYENFIWIDGDVVVNHNIDTVQKYFKDITNYPIPDIHVQEEFFGVYGNNETQLFNQNLSKFYNVEKNNPYSHICFYVYNGNCKWWFQEIIGIYKSIKEKDYKKYLLWNDEGVDNLMRWIYKYDKFLPLSNFDTSSYDGDKGETQETLHQFYKFWLENGPQNFNRIFGYQYIPENKDQIIYFHGNKNSEISDKMIEFIKMMRDKSFYNSYFFFTDVYYLNNFENIVDYEGSTLEVAEKYGWSQAIFHEIYNLKDYYKNREKLINKGDIVVDLGGNIGIFNRWAYSEGAEKVISFEPDKRYFELLSLNADPKSILFNAAVSDTIGELNLYESTHLGGSNLFGTQEGSKNYKVRTYTLDYLFESKLIDRIDFLKIDIEGSEHHALRGISDENLSKVKSISIEYHHNHFNYDVLLRYGLLNRMINLGFNSYVMYMGNNEDLQMIYFTR